MEHSIDTDVAYLNDIAATFTQASWERERTTGELINFITRREQTIEESIFNF